MLRFPALCLALALVVGCGDDGSTPATDGGSGPDAPFDAPAIDSGPPPPAWPRTLPPASELGGSRRGRDVSRAIIHLHSPLSHDACDGEGWVDGALADEACLASFRAALCDLRIDVAMVTDHAPHVEEVPFVDATWAQPGDEIITDGDGNEHAARYACSNGHRALVTVGSENSLMPVGLHHHPVDTTDPDELRAAYDTGGPAGADMFRAAGGLVLVQHTEEQSVDYLRTVQPDGIEIYNLHANLAPDIRTEFLGLEEFGFLTHLFEFMDRRKSLTSDLVFLAFFEQSPVYWERWDTLLAEGVRMPGIAGSDAHENTFSDPMPDGERADSYRRVLRWFSNHLLVDGDSPDDAAAALEAGRFYVAFEAYGSPVGFDFLGDDGSAQYDMGEDAPMGATLRVMRPSLPADHPADPPPTVSLRILKSEPGGAVEVASGSDAMLEYTPTEPGAYRAEVHIVPEHTRPYLENLADDLVREVAWVYANPIFVTAP